MWQFKGGLKGSPLTEVAECVFHFVNINVCLHLDEILYKGVAEGTLTGGETAGER